MTDVDGYTFDVKVDYHLREVTESAVNDKPGYTTARMGFSGGIELVNTTAGRDIPFKEESGVTEPLAYPKVVVLGAWGGDSAICSSLAESDECGIILMHGSIESSLPAGGSLSPHAYNGRWAGGGSAGIAEIPESSWPVIKEELLNPAEYYIAYLGVDHNRFTNLCAEGAAFGMHILSSTTGGCTEFELLAQPID